MSEKAPFRITVNLRRFFRDHRSSCKIFISNNMKVIDDLIQHITSIFNIGDFYIINQNDYLPPTEDVQVLSKDDVVEIIPFSEFELTKPKVVEEQVVVTKARKRKRKKRAKEVEDEFENLVKMKIESPSSTSTPTESILKKSNKKTDKDSAICSDNSINFVKKVKYFEDWYEKDSPGCSLKKQNKVTILSNDLISKETKSDESARSLTNDSNKITKVYEVGMRNVEVNDESPKSPDNVCHNEINLSDKIKNTSINYNYDYNEPKINLATSYCNIKTVGEKSIFLPVTILEKKTNLIKSIIKNSDAQATNDNYNYSSLPINNGNVINLPVNHNSVSYLEVNNFTAKHCNNITEPNLTTFETNVHNEDKVSYLKVKDMNTNDLSVEPKEIKPSSLKINNIEVTNEKTNIITISDTSINMSKQADQLNPKVKSLGTLFKDEIINTETESNYEDSIISIDEYDSKDLSGIKKKRKRVRKRPNKKPVEVQPTIKPFVPPKVIGKPKMHIIFGEGSKEEQDDLQDTGNVNSKQAHGSESTLNATSDNNCSSFDIKEIIEKNNVSLPVMDKTMPKIGDRIVFRVLKLAENYTPTLSNFIAAEVINFNESNGDINLLIREGEEELLEPNGKFSLLDYKTSKKNQDECYEHYTNWKELIEPRLMQITKHD